MSWTFQEHKFRTCVAYVLVYNFFHNVYVIEEHKAHVVNIKNKIIYIYIYW